MRMIYLPSQLIRLIGGGLKVTCVIAEVFSISVNNKRKRSILLIACTADLLFAQF